MVELKNTDAGRLLDVSLDAHVCYCDLAMFFICVRSLIK